LCKNDKKKKKKKKKKKMQKNEMLRDASLDRRKSFALRRQRGVNVASTWRQPMQTTRISRINIQRNFALGIARRVFGHGCLNLEFSSGKQLANGYLIRFSLLFTSFALPSP